MGKGDLKYTAVDHKDTKAQTVAALYERPPAVIDCRYSFIPGRSRLEGVGYRLHRGTTHAGSR